MMRLVKSVLTWMEDARSSMDETRAPAITYINCVEQSTLAAGHVIEWLTYQEDESEDHDGHGKTQFGFFILFP